MAKTLIIKLAETVDNASLGYLGEMRFSLKQKSAGVFAINTGNSEIMHAEIIGGDSNAHFTDSTGAQNLGKSVTIPAGANTNTYVSPHAASFRLWPKYGLTRFAMRQTGASEGMQHLVMNLDQFIGCTELVYLGINGDNWDSQNSVSGDIASLSGCKKLSFLSLMCNYNITGDISVFSGITSLVEMWLGVMCLHGNISSWANLTNLYSVNCNSNVGITGDTSSLAHLHPNNGGKLAKFVWNGCNVTGTWPPATE